MLIVSQDKDKVFNFENIVQIYITHCEEDNPYYWIRSELSNGTYENLGKYDTEVRAKEILEQIVGFYRGADMDKEYTALDALALVAIRKSGVFCMP